MGPESCRFSINVPDCQATHFAILQHLIAWGAEPNGRPNRRLTKTPVGPGNLA